MKELLKIIGFVFAAALTLAVINALINPGTRENRNQSTNTSGGDAATYAYLRSTSSSAAAQKVAAIEPTHPPTTSPPTPQIVIPTIVPTPEPIQVPVATPRLLKMSPIFDAKLVIGKSVRSVDRVLGKPIGIDPGVEVGEQLRTYDLGGYEADGYMVIVTFNARKIATAVQANFLNKDAFTLTDWQLLFERFGLKVTSPPDRQAELGAGWDNVSGLQLHIGATDDKFVEVLTIAQVDR